MTYDMDANSVPLRDVAVPPAPPAADQDSEAVLDEAVHTLIDLRLPLSSDDAAAQLHALASLREHIKLRIPGTIAAARDLDYSWQDIATCLGVSPNSARRTLVARQPHPRRSRSAS